jgi:transposase
MAKAGPKKIQRYSNEFKLTVVKLSHMKGVLVGDVAKTFDIHPWMLSRWRTEVKNGLISGKPEDLPNKKKVKPVELRQLREARAALARKTLELEVLKKPSGSVPIPQGNLRVHRCGAEPVWGEDAV